MANGLGLVFPFSNSNTNGYLLDLNKITIEKAKSDLFYFLTTQVGTRYRMPDFGCDFLKHIYEPSDDPTYSDLKIDINEKILKWFPYITINSITTQTEENNEAILYAKIVFSVTSNSFQTTDYIIMQL